jgi:CRISPR-associated endonuclease Cas2
MSVLLVAYDLHQHGQNYTDVLEYIKEHSWARLSESAYAIETSKSPSSIRDALKKVVDANDNIYVMTLSSSWASWGPEAVNKWLKDRLS